MASRAHATLTVPETVEVVEACWYETSRWPNWIDGLAEVLSVEGDWPRVGATVTWNSHPAGRGRVVERVVAYQPQGGQTIEVTDASITGQQRVAFVAAGQSVQVELSLAYTLARRTLLSPVVDLLFIRRAMTSSLRTTLQRFGVQLEGRAEATQH